MWTAGRIILLCEISFPQYADNILLECVQREKRPHPEHVPFLRSEIKWIYRTSTRHFSVACIIKRPKEFLPYGERCG